MSTAKFKMNFSGTRILKLVKINQFFSSFFGKIVSVVFWFLGVSSVAMLFLLLSSSDYYFQYLGFSQILIAIFLTFLSLRSFLRFFVNNPAIISPEILKNNLLSGNDVNVVNAFSVPLASSLLPLGNDLEEINVNDVLLSIIKSSDTNFIFTRIGHDKKEIISLIESAKSPSSVRFEILVNQTVDVAISEGHNKIETGDMLVALAESDIIFSSYLSNLNISFEDLANIVYWKTKVEEKIAKRNTKFDPEYLHLTGGIGKDWAYGYTPDLDQYSFDLTSAIESQGLELELIGHEKEIEILEQSLNRQVGANAILVGEPGVGKKTTIMGFAKKINEGRTLSNLAHKRIVELNVDLLISGLAGTGEFTERLTRVFSQAANAGNVIIFIDGIEKILSSGETGQIDATSMLVPYLSYPEINFIGTTDISSYSNLIAGNTALSQRFEKIEISEPTESEMIRILEDVVPEIEYHFGILITYQALKEAVVLAQKFILDQPNPEKSISILENSANLLSTSGEKILDSKSIEKYVSEKTNIPVADATDNEKEILLNLETELHKRVIGQVEAVRAVAGALKRSRAGVAENQKPIGSFLFLGPTGVGKTETAKALAEVYYGSAESMIRFDMSEYQNESDIYRLIGSPANYGEKIEGELIAKIRNKPFSLILFDEIEKANPAILNLFLQILDEGFITSSTGRKVYFKNSIIIVTSNAAANLIRGFANKNIEYETAKKQVISFVQDQGIFKPEFINRFTEVVYYSPLSKEEIKEVAKIMIRNLATQIIKSKGISLKIELSALEKLAELGYDPEMGARPMARIIQDKLENFLAEMILRGQATKGSEVVFKQSDIT